MKVGSRFLRSFAQSSWRRCSSSITAGVAEGDDEEGGGAWGERVGDEPTDMGGAVDVAEGNPEEVVDEALMG